jgi:methyl-accepting chemotaxis protein
MATLTDSASPPAEQGSGFGNFFRYHGWLAPGIRLLRRLSFPAKSTWVAGAFLIPLLMMLFFLWSSANDQIAFASSERQGLTYAKPVLELVKVAQNRRRAAANNAPDLPELQAAVAASFEKIKARHGELGKAFGVDEAYGAFLKAHDGLMQRPMAGAPDDTFEQHGVYIAAALDLVREVADGSQLTLDPDIDTYHMMNLSLLRGPLQYENTARLRGMGTLVLKTKELSQRRRDWIQAWVAVQSFLHKDVENSYVEGIARFPEVAKLFDMKGTDEASEAFSVAVQRQLLSPELAGDAAIFLALGNTAVEKQVFLASQIVERLDTQLAARVARLQSILATQLGIAAFFVALAGYLMFSFYRVMMGGLHEVSGHLKEITQGNLTTAPRPWGSDEAAQLMVDLRNMQESLRDMVLHVRHSSDEIVHSSSEIASGALDLSARTEQTAANLEQSAASMEQITSTIRNTSEHTVDAAKVAQHNADVAAEGGHAMREVVATMQDIRASSDKIGEIIGTIDGIAFQTNILALNAAVEAARAGEQGRGFAVVATEVRTLAQRSADAAKQIKTLIGNSVNQVVDGTTKVRKAESTIDEIISSSRRVSQLLGEISTGAREQSLGISQIGQAVQDLDRMTQQNAALVEQTAAAASSMKDQAAGLAAEVTRFKLPEGATLKQVGVDTSVADFDFDKAIEAHRQWKVKLRKAIAEHENLDAEQICRDDQCPLGKWIHGPGGTQWGHRPTFVALLGKHAEFHQTAGGVARKINAGQFTEAERLIGSGSQFAQVSTEVSTLLAKAKRGL